MALEFFKLNISLPELPHEPNEQNEDGYLYTMRVNFDNRDYLGRVQADKRRIAEMDYLAPLAIDILLQLFPFVFVFNEELTIIAIGDTLRKMYPGNTVMGRKLEEVARLRRPRGVLSWNNVKFKFCLITQSNCVIYHSLWQQCRMLQRAMCELEVLPKYQISRHHAHSHQQHCSLDDKEQRPLILRGQLRYQKDWDAIMFLCNPL